MIGAPWRGKKLISGDTWELRTTSVFCKSKTMIGKLDKQGKKEGKLEGEMDS
jgi:hypothetical protein